jgi:hypothetical protein
MTRPSLEPDAHGVRRFSRGDGLVTDIHLQGAIAEVHAARLSLQGALIALDQAREAGERLAGSTLRVLDAEIRGATEEAALIAARLADELAGSVLPCPPPRRPSTRPQSRTA